MPKAARLGDPIACGDFVASGASSVLINDLPAALPGSSTTGHHGFHPTTVTAGNDAQVFAENKPISIVGSPTATHRRGKSKHSSSISVGSGDVIIGG